LEMLRGLSAARTRVGWVAGSSPRLSGLVFVDEAHGEDSSVSGTSSQRFRHKMDPSPCRMRIPFFAIF
jgi:hypothetical protein